MSTKATSSSSIIVEIIPGFYSGSHNFNLSHTSLASHDKNIVFETPEAKTIILGDLSKYKSGLSLFRLIP